MDFYINKEVMMGVLSDKHTRQIIMRKLFLSLLFLFSYNALALNLTLINKEMVYLDIDKLKAVEIDNKLFLISGNGRFVFDGRLIDTFHKKTLTTMSEVDYANRHIDLVSMGLSIEALNTITIEGGEKKITVFVDPHCGFCKSFIEGAMQHLENYTLHLVVIPVLGKASHLSAKALFCASDKKSALSYYMKNQLTSLPQKADCNQKDYDLTLTAAQLLNIKYVPFFITHDHRIRVGAGEDFWGWVKQGDS